MAGKRVSRSRTAQVPNVNGNIAYLIPASNSGNVQSLKSNQPSGILSASTSSDNSSSMDSSEENTSSSNPQFSSLNLLATAASFVRAGLRLTKLSSKDKHTLREARKSI